MFKTLKEAPVTSRRRERVSHLFLPQFSTQTERTSSLSGNYIAGRDSKILQEEREEFLEKTAP